MERSLLYTANGGDPAGIPFLVLHERYGALEDALALGALLGKGALTIGVRGSRTQTIGAGGEIQGYFWFLGPLERPELSTLGDGLYQLELLLLELAQRHGGKVGLMGIGEGGVVALLAAMVWPEKIGALIAIDTPMPVNLDKMPLEIGPLDGLDALILDQRAAHAQASAAALAARGARARAARDVTEIAGFVAGLKTPAG